MIQYKPRPAAAPVESKSCRRSLVERMAETLREMVAAGETTTAENLVAHGYSMAVVTRYGADAVAMARRRWHRQLA